MRLWKQKTWSVIDIGLLKWSCIFSGMIAGAYLSDFTKQHVVFFVLAVVVLAMRPTISYFRDDKK